MLVVSPTNCYESVQSRQEVQAHKAQQVSIGAHIATSEHKLGEMDRLGFRLASLDVHMHAQELGGTYHHSV